MKNELEACRANDIKQKRLLGGNPAQKKIRFAFFFSLSFIFAFFLYSFSFISTLRTMLCFKCGGIGRILVFLFLFSLLSLKKIMFDL